MNPAAFASSLPKILKYFPNNTVVVRRLSCLQKTHTLPETVTGLVLKLFDNDSRPKDLLKFADRVVEILK